MLPEQCDFDRDQVFNNKIYYRCDKCNALNIVRDKSIASIELR